MTVQGDLFTSRATGLTSSRGGWKPMLLGLAVLFFGWILVIPPFGGSDEFDHAYKAAATARGQWYATPTNATRGTGAWLDVPKDIVHSAQPECQARIYTTASDCIGTIEGDTVRIASGAGRYNPLLYWAIGSAARPFKGDVALYVMRSFVAGTSLALFALALSASSTWLNSRRGLVPLAVACSPVVLYSCSIVAPNGIEMLAGLALWSALIGLLVADPRYISRLQFVAAIAGALLCTVRPLGPLWCLLIGALVVVGVRGAPNRIRLLRKRTSSYVTAGIIAISAVDGLSWTIGEKALGLGSPGAGHTGLFHRLLIVLELVPLWVLQSIAAFPHRDQPTHPSVYAAYLVVFAALAIPCFRSADRRMRVSILCATAFALGFPFLSTMESYDSYGAVWQGRYSIPLTIGLLVLAAYVLDLAMWVWRPLWGTLFGLLFVLAQAISLAWTLHLENASSPLSGSREWIQPPIWLATVLGIVGAAMMWWDVTHITLPSSRGGRS